MHTPKKDPIPDTTLRRDYVNPDINRHILDYVLVLATEIKNEAPMNEHDTSYSRLRGRDKLGISGCICKTNSIKIPDVFL